MLPVVNDLSVGELLATYAAILDELRDRSVVRTANNPAGDYAEYLVASALGLTLEQLVARMRRDRR